MEGRSKQRADEDRSTTERQSKKCMKKMARKPKMSMKYCRVQSEVQELNGDGEETEDEGN